MTVSPAGTAVPKAKESRRPCDSPFRRIRHRKRRRFLEALVESGGNVTRAAQLAGIDRTTPYTPQWRDDAEFQQALETAREMAADALESEAIRRAFEGVERPAGWYKGKPGGTVREFSDVLAIFLLKHTRPEKYGDRMHVSGGLGHVHLTAEEMSRLPDEAIARIAAGENVAAVLASMQPRELLGVIPDGEAEPEEE